MPDSERSKLIPAVMANEAEGQHGTTKEEETSVVEPNTISSQKELKNALYARCANLPAERVFNQHDLFSLEVIPNNDIHQLLICTQQLTKEGLFKLMTKDGRTCWKVVKKDDAAKYKSLSAEEALVYSYVESSGREGMWTKIIRIKANLHQTVMQRCLKSLEARSYIKQIKTVKYPNRKMYMLAHLQASEDVTGGPFYTDSTLDDEFVLQVANWTENYVAKRSWWYPPSSDSKRKKDKSKMSQAQAESLRNEAFHSTNTRTDTSRDVLPMPPGYTGYPTIPQITKAINGSNLTTGVVMKEAEMRQLMDVLCWDGRLEKIGNGNGNGNGKGYKSIRPVGEVFENGLTEAPCGRCPVFDICEEGGPVNARTCKYFQEWLEY